MKKFNLFIFSFLISFSFIFNLNALCTEDCIAQIGEEKYSELKDAVSSVPTDGTKTTITILMDKVTPGFDVENGKNIVIDFNNHTVTLGTPLVGSTGTVTNSVRFLKGSNILLKNGTLKPSNEAKIFIQNYANLTIENMLLDATDNTYSGLYALSNNNGIVLITGNTSILSNAVAIDAYDWPKNGYTDGTQITINTTGKIKGKIEMTSDGTRVGNTLSTITINNINHEGTFNIQSNLKDKFIVLGGTYTTNPKEYIKDDTLTSTQSGSVYIVEKIKEIVTTDTSVTLSSTEELKNNYVLLVSDAKNEFEQEKLVTINSNIEKVIKSNSKDNKKQAEDINVLSLLDIRINDGTKDVLMDQGKYTITVTLPEDYLKYEEYDVVYVNYNGEVDEPLNATLNGDKLTFTTTHLSTYAVIGYNYSDIMNPDTLDNVVTSISVSVILGCSIILVALFIKNNYRIKIRS